MIKRFRTKPTLVALAAAAITALGVGGVAVAQSGNTPDQPTQTQREAAEQQGAPENSAADRDDVQDENGKDDASEKGEANEKADDDGPGGHADEPGNPNADHQFEGQE